MVSANPPSARMVSQRCSASDSRPSAWLCVLVSGASMKRFFIAGPRASERGSNSFSTDIRCLTRNSRPRMQRAEDASRLRLVMSCQQLLLGLRQQAFALSALARQFPRPADGFGLLARLAFGGLLEMVAAFHLPEEALALHLLLERLQRLVDVVVADNDLNDLKLSIFFPGWRRGWSVWTQKRRTGRKRSFKGCVPLPADDLCPPPRDSMAGRRGSDTIGIGPCLLPKPAEKSILGPWPRPLPQPPAMPFASAFWTPCWKSPPRPAGPS